MQTYMCDLGVGSTGCCHSIVTSIADVSVKKSGFDAVAGGFAYAEGGCVGQLAERP